VNGTAQCSFGMQILYLHESPFVSFLMNDKFKSKKVDTFK